MDLRLAELVAGLSVVSDLGKGLTEGQGIRSATLAMRIADLTDLPDDDRVALYWLALLRFVGCTATASDMAATLGDEIAVSAAFADADVRDLRDVLRRTVTLVGGRPDRVVGFLARTPRVIGEHETASCEVAQTVAQALGLPVAASDGLSAVFERYDGKGNPGHREGTEIPVAVRVWQVAHIADLLAAQHERATVATELANRAGGALDPDIAKTVAAQLDNVLEPPIVARTADVLALEPTPWRTLGPDRVADVLGVFGLLADLKSPHFRGHSRRVSDLAAAAGVAADLPEDEVDLLRRAGLVHDVGRVAVSSRIWDAPGALGDAEVEQARLHPYYTQRVLDRVPALRPLTDIACSHHECCDGSGYHRGLAHAVLSPGALILAAADAYATSCESRPNRAALTPDAAMRLLRTEVAAGRLDSDAVEAVLLAAGHTVARKPAPSTALTAREVEVIDLVAGGLTNRAIGHRLGISAKTVNTHLEHTYAKLRVSTRAAAVVECTRRGWIG